MQQERKIHAQIRHLQCFTLWVSLGLFIQSAYVKDNTIKQIYTTFGCYSHSEVPCSSYPITLFYSFDKEKKKILQSSLACQHENPD